MPRFLWKNKVVIFERERLVFAPMDDDETRGHPYDLKTIPSSDPGWVPNAQQQELIAAEAHWWAEVNAAFDNDNAIAENEELPFTGLPPAEDEAMDDDDGAGSDDVLADDDAWPLAWASEDPSVAEHVGFLNAFVPEAMTSDESTFEDVAPDAPALEVITTSTSNSDPNFDTPSATTASLPATPPTPSNSLTATDTLIAHHEQELHKAQENFHEMQTGLGFVRHVIDDLDDLSSFFSPFPSPSPFAHPYPNPDSRALRRQEARVGRRNHANPSYATTRSSPEGRATLRGCGRLAKHVVSYLALGCVGVLDAVSASAPAVGGGETMMPGAYPGEDNSDCEGEVQREEVRGVVSMSDLLLLSSGKKRKREAFEGEEEECPSPGEDVRPTTLERRVLLLGGTRTGDYLEVEASSGQGLPKRKRRKTARVRWTDD